MCEASSNYSDYIVYVDESGNHSLAKYDREFPVFVLTFCIFRKDEYVGQIVPALQRIKFKHFGHDMIVFHEREIRKASGPFTFLTDAGRRADFMADLNDWVEQSPFAIICIVIRKEAFSVRHADASNPYLFAMKLGLERVEKYLRRREPIERRSRIVFEARGKREDDELEKEFLQVCNGVNYVNKVLSYQIVFAPKSINSSGLQLADLTARPIGRHVMNPDQPNRAYDIIEKKLDRSPNGKVEDYGLKTYP